MFGNEEETQIKLLDEYFHETHWTGYWKDKSNENAFLAEMDLSVANGGKIDGTITWTVTKSNWVYYQNKIGVKANETVNGDFNFANSKLSLTGLSKFDPDSIIDQAKCNLNCQRIKTN